MPAAVLSGLGLTVLGAGLPLLPQEMPPAQTLVGGTRPYPPLTPPHTPQGLVRREEVRSCSPEARAEEEEKPESGAS